MDHGVEYAPSWSVELEEEVGWLEGQMQRLLGQQQQMQRMLMSMHELALPFPGATGWNAGRYIRPQPSSALCRCDQAGVY